MSTRFVQTTPPGNSAGGNLAHSRMAKVVDLVCASHIEPRAIHWIWEGWLAAGKFHVLAGTAGTGKTHLAIHAAAVVSTGGIYGRRWPDGAFAPKGKVVIWTGEDGVDDTIIPRLLAAGADMQNVYVLEGTRENGRSRSFDFSKDLDQLSYEISRIGGVSLVIIDSIVQAVVGDSNSNSEVRHSLEPLLMMADRNKFAIVGITHVVKGSKRKDPLDRVAGSLAFGAVARVVMITAKIASDPSDETPGRCVLVRVKSNIGPDDGGLEYRNESAEFEHRGQTYCSSHASWNPEPLQGSGRDILAWAEGETKPKKASAVDIAIDFLRQQLQSDPVAVSLIEERAKAACISLAALKRAKSALNVQSYKPCGGNGFVWYMQRPAEQRPSNSSDSFAWPSSNWPSSFAEPFAPVAPVEPVEPVELVAPQNSRTTAVELDSRVLECGKKEVLRRIRDAGPVENDDDEADLLHSIVERVVNDLFEDYTDSRVIAPYRKAFDHYALTVVCPGSC